MIVFGMGLPVHHLMKRILPLLCLGLAACAGRGAPAVLPVPPVAGKMLYGTVAAIRPVDIASAQDAQAAGINAVLAALQQPALTPPVTAQEVVIRTDDGGAVSIISAVPHSPGQKVGILQGTPTSLLLR